MRKSLNVNKHTLDTYYNFIQSYNEILNEAENNYLDSTDVLLEYCYDIATLEFEDDQKYHAANEYKSHEAQVIIAAAERYEEIVDEYIEDDDEYNSLFEEVIKK